MEGDDAQIFILDDRGERILCANEAAAAQAQGKSRFVEVVRPLNSQEGVLAALRATDGPKRAYRALQRDLNGREQAVWVRVQRLNGPHAQGASSILASVSEQSEGQASGRILPRPQRMEAVGQLTGGLAHDFNNVLTVISGNLELLSLEIEAGELSECRDLVEGAMLAVRRGADLTQRLLAIARQKSVDPRAIDPALILDKLVPLIRRSLGHQVEVSLDLADFREQPASVVVDESLFESSVLNLAINALDAMPMGGNLHLSLSRETRDSPCTENGLTVPPGEYIRLTVRDSGTGIPRNVLPRVLDPFFTTKRAGRGSGLGLSMVHGFVEQYRGTLWIESEIGRGTTVHLLLPTTSNPVSDPVNEQLQSRQTVSGNGRVLVIEDEPAVLRLASEILNGAGYQTLEARNAEEAMCLIEQGESFDVVFTDLYFPGAVSSEEFIRYVLDTWPDRPIVATSGYLGRHDSKGLRHTSFLGKPYSPNELTCEIDRALQRRHDTARCS